MGVLFVLSGHIGDAAEGFGAAIPIVNQTNHTRSDHHCVAVGDINGDGIEDIVYLSSADDLVYCLAGAGDGSFGLKQQVGSVDFPFALALFDYDLDGDLDVICGAGASPVGTILFRNLGKGSFATPVYLHGSFSPSEISFARIDGDIWPDLVLLQEGAVVWYKNDRGRGTVGFDNIITSTFPDHPSRNPEFAAMVLEDLNRDGKSDLAIAAKHTISGSIQEGAGLFFHLRTGNGIPGSPNTLLEYEWQNGINEERAQPDFLRAFDLNGDGDKELIFPRNDSSTETLLIVRNDGGAFQSQIVTSHFNGFSGSRNAAAADFDLDGDTDLAVALDDPFVTNDGQIRMLWNDGSQGAVMTPGGSAVTAQDGRLGALAARDFTGDGLTDLLVQFIPASGNNGVGRLILLPRTEANLTEDSYVGNYSRSNAFDLRQRQGRFLSRVGGFGRAFSGHSDFYRVSVKRSSVSLDLKLRFTHDAGDLRLVVYDVSGSEVDRSDTSDHNESLSLQLSAGDYFVEIAGGTAQGVAYDFGWFHNADFSPPRVAYKKPRNRSEMKRRATHSGKATDDCAVARVRYKWTRGKWRVAKLSPSGRWSFVVKSKHRDYKNKRSVTVLVQAFDTAGKRSKTARRTFRR